LFNSASLNTKEKEIVDVRCASDAGETRTLSA